MKNVLKILLIVLSISPIIGKGNLFLIGGGNRPDYMIKKMIELAGGTDAKIIIIPNASGDPIDVAKYQQNQFKENGSNNVSFIYLKNNEANSDSIVIEIESANGIFFSGGDQRRLAEVLLNTKALKAIKNIYEEGALIAGTSAGTAVMSKIMITGDELKIDDDENPFGHLLKENIKTSEGIGFLENVIIDQHFIKRKRYNRLFSLVIENPDKLGIGVDESTAIIVKDDNTFEVFGESQVVVFDAKDAKVDTCDELLFGDNIKISFLKHGNQYDLNVRKLIK